VDGVFEPQGAGIFEVLRGFFWRRTQQCCLNRRGLAGFHQQVPGLINIGQREQHEEVLFVYLSVQMSLALG
jgi:hypothetical protein